MANNKENELDKQDSAEVKNYTRTPNMLIFGYNNISPQEKWLYVCLKHMCGKRGTRHLSLRYISEQTGISVGALSRSKDKKGNINEGMIKHLHDVQLIHAEIKKLNGRGNPLYHITITDVWGLNQEFFSKTRPNSEQDENEENEPVRNSDVPVQNSDKLARNSDKPVQNSDEPVRKPLQYQDYIQDYKQDDNNTREQERESPPNTLDTHTIVSSDTAHADSLQDEEMFRNDEPQGDTHATLPASGHPHRVGEPATRGGDSDHTAVDNGHVATPEVRPVLEAQEEINEKGQTDDGNQSRASSSHPDGSGQHMRVSGNSGSRDLGQAHQETLTQIPPTSMPAQSLPLPQAEQAALGTKQEPKPLVEPDMSGKWSHEKCVEYAEWCNQKRYTEKMHEEQLKAAHAIHKNDVVLTLEQFKQAYDERNDAWWKEHKGKLHVNDMKARGASGIDRVHEMLQRIEDAASKCRAQTPRVLVPAPSPNQPITNIRELVRQRELLRQQQAVGV